MKFDMKFDWYKYPSALLLAMRIKLMEEIIEIDIEIVRIEKEIEDINARYTLYRPIERKD